MKICSQLEYTDMFIVDFFTSFIIQFYYSRPRIWASFVLNFHSEITLEVGILISILQYANDTMNMVEGSKFEIINLKFLLLCFDTC